jgi:hypothetical protein
MGNKEINITNLKLLDIHSAPQIAILYICTGRYSIFWDKFYSSAEKNLLRQHRKSFFVFTDNKLLLKRKQSNVDFIYQQKLGWPLDTLYRYKIFLRIADKLQGYDYVYFINANALIVSEVGDEILPDPFLLIGSQHPCYYDKKPDKFIYDRNPNSSACIEMGIGSHYVMGAFIGGETSAFLLMCRQLDYNIDQDFKKSIIALWHDESHYNKYLLFNPYKLLPPSYVYPEEMNIPFVPKIVLRDKNKYGGHAQLRGIKKDPSFYNYVKQLIRRTII